MKALGRIVIVKHLDTAPIKSSLISLPDNVVDAPHTKAVEAEVVAVGSKSVYNNLLFPKSKVLVPFHLGTRQQIEDQKVVIYDDGDVLALLP